MKQDKTRSACTCVDDMYSSIQLNDGSQAQPQSRAQGLAGNRHLLSLGTSLAHQRPPAPSSLCGRNFPCMSGMRAGLPGGTWALYNGWQVLGCHPQEESEGTGQPGGSQTLA